MVQRKCGTVEVWGLTVEEENNNLSYGTASIEPFPLFRIEEKPTSLFEIIVLNYWSSS